MIVKKDKTNDATKEQSNLYLIANCRSKFRRDIN